MQKNCSLPSINFNFKLQHKWYKAREFGTCYRAKFAKNLCQENLEMSKLFVMLVMFFSLFASHMAFADAQEEAEMKCRMSADEQEISKTDKEEMAEFMEECVKTLLDSTK